MNPAINSNFVEVEGLRLHYLEAGRGEPVLLLHGWPTSSFLWRNVMVSIAERNRVIALDLPGFGRSDKPLDVSYSFRFFERTVDAFLDSIDVRATGLAVHDLGGPVGLYWAARHTDRLTKLALLNTIVYPQMSWAVVFFVAAVRLPLLRSLLASPWGLKFAMQTGIADASKVTDEVVRGVQEPFDSPDSRRALLKAGGGLHPAGFKEIEAWLPSLAVPVRVVFGERDRILPDVAKTMKRVKEDLPQTDVTSLPDCGHFLQEEHPEEIGRMLADFFA